MVDVLLAEFKLHYRMTVRGQGSKFAHTDTYNLETIVNLALTIDDLLDHCRLRLSLSIKTEREKNLGSGRENLVRRYIATCLNRAKKSFISTLKKQNQIDHSCKS